MASSKEYLEFILEQLSGLDELTYKTMMGEYMMNRMICKWFVMCKYK